MDWLQWSSGIVGSLAWPSVAALFLVLVRNHLSGLVGRLEELTLPGGTSAKFGKALAESRETAEKARLSESDRSTAALAQQDALVQKDYARNWELTEQFPEAAIMQSFGAIEDVIANNKDRLPAAKGSLYSYVKELGNRGLLSKEMVQLFKSLQNLRNIAAHGRGTDRVAPGEAIEYQAQCSAFVAALEGAFSRLPK